MFHVVTALWDANEHSRDFSQGYSEVWVDRLYAGFKRHLSLPFVFTVMVDRFRRFANDDICQEQLAGGPHSYADLIQAFRRNQPMILVGLDTIITGHIDHFADYCLTASEIALPRNPKKPEVSCNGVALVPAGKRAWFNDWRGENDMAWMDSRPHVLIDDLFPGQVLSAKVQVKRNGLGDARIVYFHGHPKPTAMTDVDWVKRHWLGQV